MLSEGGFLWNSLYDYIHVRFRNGVQLQSVKNCFILHQNNFFLKSTNKRYFKLFFQVVHNETWRLSLFFYLHPSTTWPLYSSSSSSVLFVHSCRCDIFIYPKQTHGVLLFQLVFALNCTNHFRSGHLQNNHSAKDQLNRNIIISFSIFFKRLPSIFEKFSFWYIN